MSNFMMRKLLVAVCIYFLINYSCASVYAFTWPRVRETEARIGFTYGGAYFAMVLPIYSVDGKRLYTFNCMGGNLTYLDRFSDRTGLDVVGPLMCTLEGSGVEGGANLLSEGAYYEPKPWFTRGYFSPELFENFDTCQRYPEYGARRTFRLRGMRLDVVIKRPEHDDPQFEEFEMSVSVKNDPIAVTPTAEPAIYRNPYAKGGACSKVEVGVEAVLSPDILARIPDKFLHLPPFRVAGVMTEDSADLRLVPDFKDPESVLRRFRSSFATSGGITIIWPANMDRPTGCYGKSVVFTAVKLEKTADGQPILQIGKTIREIREVSTNAVCWTRKASRDK